LTSWPAEVQSAGSFSAISDQRSAIGDRRSAISIRLSVFGFRRSAIRGGGASGRPDRRSLIADRR
jgi:hypothetical protein